MNCASATMPASRSSWIAFLFCAIVVSLRKRSSLSCAAASVPSETWTSPARRNIGSSFSSRRMSVTRVLMPHCKPRSRAISSSQNAMNFLRWIVGSSSARMKKPTLCSRTSDFDLVDHRLRIAYPVVAPELPLAAEAARKRTATREVRDRNAHPHRDVDVLVPLEDAPVGQDAVEIRDRRLGRRRDHFAAGEIGDAFHRAAVDGPRTIVDRANQVQENLFAFAAHNRVDPRRLAQHLRVHERAVDAPQHRDNRRVDLLGKG